MRSQTDAHWERKGRKTDYHLESSRGEEKVPWGLRSDRQDIGLYALWSRPGVTRAEDDH